MAFVLDKKEKWSERGLSLAIWSTVVAVVLALADGVFKGPLAIKYGMGDMHYAAVLSMLATWTYDLRQTVDGLIYIGALVFIGAKFFETRTIFTVGFDNLDGAKISMKGPDDDNIVWIGHRYGTRMEAETIAATIESRLKESAA
jgi:hypothetical protein